MKFRLFLFRGGIRSDGKVVIEASYRASKKARIFVPNRVIVEKLDTFLNQLKTILENRLFFYLLGRVMQVK